MEEECYKVETSDGHILEVEKWIAHTWSKIFTGKRLVKGEIVKIPTVKKDTLEKIIEWCKIGKDKEIFIIPEGDGPMWLWKLQEWNADFLGQCRGFIAEFITAAYDIGCMRLIDSCCRAVADMIKEKAREKELNSSSEP